MSSEQARQLRQQGIEAAKAGRKDEAHRLLQQALRLDPGNEAAWLWMASVAGDKRERLYCLKKLLEINPANETALKAVRALGVSPEELLGGTPATPAPPAAPVPPAAPPPAVRPRPLAPPAAPSPPPPPPPPSFHVPVPGPAGIPVPDPARLEVLQDEADEIAQAYLEAALMGGDIEWVRKERRRAGERDILVLRLQVTAAVIAFLVVVGGAVGAVVLGNPDVRRAVFLPTATFTLSPTMTPSPTLGITPTPSPTSPVTLTPSPTMNPFIRPGSVNAPVRATELFFLPESASGNIRQIAVLLDDNEPEKAFPLISTEQAANVTSLNPNPYYYEAIAYLERGDPDQALQVLTDTETRWQDEAPGKPYGPLLDIGFGQVYLALAKQAQQQGDTREANRLIGLGEDRANSVLETNPNYPQPYVLLARFDELKQNYDDAVKILNEGIQTEALAADLNLRVELGNVYIMQGEYEQAIQAAYEALYIDPYSQQAYQIEIRAALANGQPGRAVIFSENYLNRYPGSVLGFKYRGDGFLAEGKTDLALENYTRALLGDQTDPAIPQVLLARASLYMQQRRYELAREDYTLAYSLTGEDSVRALRMQAAYNNGNYGIAASDAEALLGKGVVPDPEILLLQARILVDQARASNTADFEQAQQLINDSINKGLDASLRPIAEEYLARADYNLGSYADALTAIGRALSATETGSRHYLRGLILQAMDRPDEAAAEFEWVLTWSEIYPYPFRVDAARHLADIKGVTLASIIGEQAALEVTPEVTPEATTEVTPEVTPESTVEATAEVTPESTVEATAEATAESSAAEEPTPTPES